MRLQLDTEAKTIKIENNVKISELIATLKKLMPQGEWKEFELQTNTVINHWSNPVVINDWTYPYYRQPFYCKTGYQIDVNVGKNQFTMATDTNKSYGLKAGIFNIQC